MTLFPYLAATSSPTSLMPRLPLTLSIGDRSTDVIGLVDTGAAVNVLPYEVGLALGAVWEEQRTQVELAVNLGQFEARALIVMASHPQIPSNAKSGSSLPGRRPKTLRSSSGK